MTNKERRQIIDEAKANGYQGSYVDLFRQHEGLGMPIASTPEEQEQGLRPLHDAGRTDASMAFTDVPPNTPFNTVGMKAPIDIKKYDEQGHLVKSYESVPPGVVNLNTGPSQGTVIETPAARRMQWGDFTNSDGPRVPALSDAEMSLKIIQEANAGNPAARRMRSDYGQKMFLEGETDPSTHYMGSFDKYAVPLVQENYTGGPLSYNENPAPSKADFKFNTPEQADYFAKNYKKATAAKAFNKRMQRGDFKERSGLSAEQYETAYNQALETYGGDVALAFDPQTQKFRPGNAFLGTAEVEAKVDRDESGNPIFKSDMAKDRYYANKNLGEQGGNQMRDMQRAVQEDRNTFAKNYLAPVAAGMLGYQALPYLAAAGEATYAAAAPVLGPIVGAEIAGVPGLTLGNTAVAGFASDFLVNRAPKLPGQIASGDYMAAAENIGFGALDLAGVGATYRAAAKAPSVVSGLKSSTPNMMSKGTDLWNKVNRFIENKIELPIMRRLPKYQRRQKEVEQAARKGDQFVRDWYDNPRTRHHLEQIGEELAPVFKDDPFVTPLANQTKPKLAQAQRVVDTHEEVLGKTKVSLANKLKEAGYDATKADELAKAALDNEYGNYYDALKNVGAPHRRGDLSKFSAEEVTKAKELLKEMPYLKTDYEAYNAIMYLNRGDELVNSPYSAQIPSMGESLIGLADDVHKVPQTRVERGAHDYLGIFRSYATPDQPAGPTVSEYFGLTTKDLGEISKTAAHEVGHGAHNIFDSGISTSNRILDKKLAEAMDPSVKKFTTRGKYTSPGEDRYGYYADTSELKSRTLEMRESIYDFFPAAPGKSDAATHALAVGNWDALSKDQQLELAFRLLHTKAGTRLNDYAFQSHKYFDQGSEDHLEFLAARMKHLLRYAPAATGAAAVGAAQSGGGESRSDLKKGGFKRLTDRRKRRK